MKKFVKAASKSPSTKVREAVEFLGSVDVDEHDILMHFFDYLPSAKSLEVLKDYIKMADLDEEYEEYLNDI